MHEESYSPGCAVSLLWVEETAASMASTINATSLRDKAQQYLRQLIRAQKGGEWMNRVAFHCSTSSSSAALPNSSASSASSSSFVPNTSDLLKAGVDFASHVLLPTFSKIPSQNADDLTSLYITLVRSLSQEDTIISCEIHWSENKLVALEAGANGRFRISGIVAGFTVFLFVMVAAPLIKIITVSSLIGLMVAVILATMDWGSIWFVVLALLPQRCRDHPKWVELSYKYPSLSSKRKIRRVDAIVIVIVWIVTIVQDLFVAVAAGVAVTALAYAWDMGERFTVSAKVIQNGKLTVKIYTIHGPVFFASTQRFVKLFDFKNDPDRVELHFDRDGSDLVDYSAIHAINVVSDKYKKQDKKLVVKYLSARASDMMKKAGALQTFEIDHSTTSITSATGPTQESKEDEFVTTTMGKGKIVGHRNKDGFVAVELVDWTLANNAKVTMFVQTKALL
jgi:hypothetical protein